MIEREERGDEVEKMPLSPGCHTPQASLEGLVDSPDAPRDHPPMPAYDFKAPRLFVEAALAPGAVLPLERAQANYLINVLRRGEDDPVLVFNGRDGEWRTKLVATGRKDGALHLIAQTRPQTGPGDLHYLFAPLKSARLDYLAQKAVEMGAGVIRPVLTRFTQGDRVNMDRLRANAVEAAEQCGILTIPRLLPPTRLAEALAASNRSGCWSSATRMPPSPIR